MEVIIKGSPEEVAALVIEIQERQEDVAKRFAEEMLIRRKNSAAGDIG